MCCCNIYARVVTTVSTLRTDAGGVKGTLIVVGWTLGDGAGGKCACCGIN